MINLTSHNTRTMIRSLYRRRLIVVSASFLCFLIILAIASLVPAYLDLSYRLEVVNESLTKAEARPVSRDANKLATEVKSLNDEIMVVSGVTKQESLISLIDRIQAIKVPGISTKFISIVSNRVTLRAQANKRSSLLAFIEAIEKEGSFLEVSSPISNLIVSNDIDFSVTMKLVEKK